MEDGKSYQSQLSSEKTLQEIYEQAEGERLIFSVGMGIGDHSGIFAKRQ